MSRFHQMLAVFAALAGGTAVAQVVGYSGFLNPKAGALGLGINSTGAFQVQYDTSNSSFTITGTVDSQAMSSPVPAPPPAITSGDVVGAPLPDVSLTVSANGSVVSLQLIATPSIYQNTQNYSFSGGGLASPGALQVVTFYSGGLPVSSGTFTPVPEPETYAAAAALGLVGFGIWRRRNA